jgi:hypothetical protein
MRKNQTVALVVLIAFMAGFPVPGRAQSVRVIPVKGSVTVIENGRETVFKSEIPLPEGAVMVCRGECLVNGPGYRLTARDGARFSVKLNTGRDRDAASANLAAMTVEEGNISVTLAPNTRIIVIGADGQAVALTSGAQTSTFVVSAAGGVLNIAAVEGSLLVVNTVTGATATLTPASGTIAAATLAPLATAGTLTPTAIAVGVAGAAAVAGGVAAATTSSSTPHQSPQ